MLNAFGYEGFQLVASFAVPYLDRVEGVPRDDGADAAETAGQEVLHLTHPLLLRHRGRVENPQHSTTILISLSGK